MCAVLLRASWRSECWCGRSCVGLLLPVCYVCSVCVFVGVISVRTVREGASARQKNVDRLLKMSDCEERLEKTRL